MRGPGHSDPEKGQGGGLRNIFFSGPQFGQKIRGGGGGLGSLGPSPGSTFAKLKRSNRHSQEDVAD